MAVENQEHLPKVKNPWVLEWSPLLMFVVSSVGLLISLVMALSNDHVTIYMPFISDIGDQVPESGVFCVALTFEAYFGILMVVYRYMTTNVMIEGQPKRVRRSNIAALVTGILGMCGMVVVAAFPVRVSLIMHGLGASCFFLCVSAYTIFNTYITFKVNHQYDSTKMRRLRVALLAVIVICYVPMTITSSMGFHRWKVAYPDRLLGCKRPGDEAFGILLFASICEWTVATASSLYFLTFISDFKKFRLITRVEEASKKAKQEEMKKTEIPIDNFINKAFVETQ